MADLENEKINSFMENIKSQNNFSVKLFLEMGIINSKTLNNALKLCIDRYLSANLIKLLLDYGAKMPNNACDLLKLPDELFFDYAENISFNMNFESFEYLLSIKNLTKKKWNYIIRDFDMDGLSMANRYDFLRCAYEHSPRGCTLFNLLLKPILDNKQFLYRLLLDIGFPKATDNLFMGYPQTHCYHCCKYLIDQLFLDENQILLCEIIGLKCMYQIYEKNNCEVFSSEYIKKIINSPDIKNMLKDFHRTEFTRLEESK